MSVQGPTSYRPPPPPVRPPADEPRAEWPKRQILLAVALAGATVAALILFWPGRPDRLGPRPPEPPEAKYAEAARHFRSQSLDAIDPEELKAIHGLFERFQDAVRTRDGGKLVDCFDAARMFRETQRLGVFAEAGRSFQNAFVKGLEKGLPEALLPTAEALMWQRYELRAVCLSDDGKEAVVYFREWDANQSVSKCRWWIRKTGGRWRLYDMEDLEAGLRISTLMAAAVEGALGRPKQLHNWTEHLRAAVQAVLNEDLHEARRLLTSLGDASLPATLEAVRLMLLGSAHAGCEQYTQALALYDRAEAHQADMPILHYSRAVAYNALGRHEEALACARKYEQLLGGDSDVDFEIGYALEHLRRPAEAAESYRKALDDTPDCLEALTALARVLPDAEKGEVAEHFARLPDPRLDFEAVAEELVSADDDRALEAVVEAYRKLAASDPEVDYYAAQVRRIRKQYPAAAALLKAAIPRVADPRQRRYYLDLHVEVLLAWKTPLEAYRQAVDAAHAFWYVAEGLVESKDRETLGKLIDAHGRRMPGDVWLHYYTGEMHLLAEQYDQAERAYARAMAQPAREDDHNTFRVARVFALFKAGRGLEAYGKVGGRKATFNQLARLLSEAGDADRLAALVAAHEKADPDDTDLPLWRAEVKWLRGLYAEVVSDLTRDRRTILANSANQGQYEDRLIRSLTRTGRLKRALVLAKASTARDGDPWYEVVVNAAAGHVDAAVAALGICVAQGYGSEDMYGDDDFSAALKQPALKALREKYPPPQPGEDPAPP